MAGYESVEEMENVIARWLELIPGDSEISEGSKGYDVSVEFEVEDLDFFFYIHFKDGDFSGGIGEFPGEAMVELCLSSEVFDGMFSGELDATTAAMSGDLAFAGDVSAAMGLQSLQDDLNRLYLAARGGGS
ncbi:MAG TPA: SCP2 sterol-binding domain-containing protein [Anaerolineae bacterium]|nr:SCP2 sterol-binding domain-containing protein [Anaerolineae bacterium]